MVWWLCGIPYWWWQVRRVTMESNEIDWNRYSLALRILADTTVVQLHLEIVYYLYHVDLLLLFILLLLCIDYTTRAVDGIANQMYPWTNVTEETNSHVVCYIVTNLERWYFTRTIKRSVSSSQYKKECPTKYGIIYCRTRHRFKGN